MVVVSTSLDLQHNYNSCECSSLSLLSNCCSAADSVKATLDQVRKGGPHEVTEMVYGCCKHATRLKKKYDDSSAQSELFHETDAV